MAKQKYATWEKLAKAVDALEAERAQRREASRPVSKAGSIPTPPRWAGADPFEHLKKALARHKARRAQILAEAGKPQEAMEAQDDASAQSQEESSVEAPTARAALAKTAL